MNKFTAWIKRIFSFLFSNSNEKPIQHDQVSEEKGSILEQAKSVFEKYKKKKEAVHKIPHNPFTFPKHFSYKRGLGNVQQIVEWDGEYFPGRWRTRLIYHV